MATHSSILAWKITWTEEPGRLQSMESQRVRHNWVTSLSFEYYQPWSMGDLSEQKTSRESEDKNLFLKMLITRRQWITGANGEGLPEGELSLRISQKSSLWNKLYMSSELYTWWKLQVRIYAINFYSVSLCASHSAGNGERESQWIGNEGLSLCLLSIQRHGFFFFFFWLGLFIIIIFFFLLYNIVLVLPYINMHLPRVYTCSPSWTPLRHPSPYHPSGSSQCISPKHPVSCIKPGLVISFLYVIIHV